MNSTRIARVWTCKNCRLQDIQLLGRLSGLPRRSRDRGEGGLFLKMCGCAPCPWVCWGPRRAVLPDADTIPSATEDSERVRPFRPPNGFPVAIGEGFHPFPFRTRKLSPPPPMVLQAQVCGRVGHCRGYIKARRVVSMRRAFSFELVFGHAPRALGAFPGPCQ